MFDEVDTGVSGRAAQKVAEKMARISRTKQVLCVTHLPQLAAMADTHFSVEKGAKKKVVVEDLDPPAGKPKIETPTHTGDSGSSSSGNMWQSG